MALPGLAARLRFWPPGELWSPSPPSREGGCGRQKCEAPSPPPPQVSCSPLPLDLQGTRRWGEEGPLRKRMCHFGGLSGGGSLQAAPGEVGLLTHQNTKSAKLLRPVGST